MMFAIFQNLPELILGLCWTVTVFFFGSKYGRWRAS